MAKKKKKTVRKHRQARSAKRSKRASARRPAPPVVEGKRRGRPPRGYVRLEVRIPAHVREMVISEAHRRSTPTTQVSAGDVVVDAIMRCHGELRAQLTPHEGVRLTPQQISDGLRNIAAEGGGD